MINGSLSWSLLPLLVAFLALTNLGFCEDGSGSGQSCEDGLAITMDDQCAPICDTGYNWCDEGRSCKEEELGYSCQCSTGYYENNIGSCQIGRYFGGAVYFTATSRSTCHNSTTFARQTVYSIYGDSAYFVKATILDFNNESCSATYELVYEDNDSVNTSYIESTFYNVTKNCSEPTLVSSLLKFDCEASSETIIDSKVLCNEGSGKDSCDGSTAECATTDSGYFVCECKSSNYILAYPASQSCIEIKCRGDEDCSGGGIHGSCNTAGSNIADNFCQCNWGFTGEKCEDPWWFVFTVLTGALGVLVIVMLVACIFMSTKPKTVKSDAQKDDLDLKNPFVDFQPGVRAKVSTNIYSSVTDSISSPTTQGHSNPAFNNNAYDERDKATPYAAAAQGNDYF